MTLARGLGCIALLLLAVTTARAGEPDPLSDARVHYERGMAHYQVGEFAQAVDEFKIAYEASRAPGLLFNLAQASRLAKQYEQALYLYRSYLRARPDAPNRADAEARIVELEPIVAELQKKQRAPDPTGDPAPTAAPPSSPPPPPSPPSSPPRNGARERIAGLTTGAVGVVALALGIYFGTQALDAQNRLAGVSTWDGAAQSLYGSGRNDAMAATALYVTGGAAVAAGAALYLVGWRRDVRARRFAVAPGSLGLACAF